MAIPEGRRSYRCALCKFAVPGKLALMNHVKTIKHLQMEQIHQLQKRSEGNEEQTEIGDIFQVREERPRADDDGDGDDGDGEDGDGDEAEQQLVSML
jgi:AT-binding transcription factor 1